MRPAIQTKDDNFVVISAIHGKNPSTRKKLFVNNQSKDFTLRIFEIGSRPPLAVAQARKNYSLNLWIPACAGMT